MLRAFPEILSMSTLSSVMFLNLFPETVKLHSFLVHGLTEYASALRRLSTLTEKPLFSNSFLALPTSL